VLRACIIIHTEIGPGCFEIFYEETLYYELVKKDIAIERPLLMPIRYKDLEIRDAYRVNLLVEKKLVIEIKSVERIAPVHFKASKHVS
jgi:GxxExxY protein